MYARLLIKLFKLRAFIFIPFDLKYLQMEVTSIKPLIFFLISLSKLFARNEFYVLRGTSCIVFINYERV